MVKGDIELMDDTYYNGEREKNINDIRLSKEFNLSNLTSNYNFIPWEGTFTWTIEEFSNLKNKIYSERFCIGPYSWRLLFFPAGNPRLPINNRIAVYLDYPDITAVNHKDITKSFMRASIPDWGFAEFMPLNLITEPEGFLQNNAFTLNIYMNVYPKE